MKLVSGKQSLQKTKVTKSPTHNSTLNFVPAGEFTLYVIDLQKQINELKTKKQIHEKIINISTCNIIN